MHPSVPDLAMIVNFGEVASEPPGRLLRSARACRVYSDSDTSTLNPQWCLNLDLPDPILQFRILTLKTLTCLVWMLFAPTHTRRDILGEWHTLRVGPTQQPCSRGGAACSAPTLLRRYLLDGRASR